ncbi:hypothetical protein GCM10011501_03700 [Thalassotalea profundi]|uniref:Uncharacterized protein n=1 Tax=Thalassotalea profundi TaxID=2036687 RepID=A0ABQ3IFE8_9GAMM|nr:hypothetical protein GCM10011501_03700 [Thalassotalea profundi]
MRVTWHNRNKRAQNKYSIPITVEFSTNLNQESPLSKPDDIFDMLFIIHNKKMI